MSKIVELREKRHSLWEQTKNFLEEHRDGNGLVAAEFVDQYDRMSADVAALGAEIERLEKQAEMDAMLSQPTTRPVQNAPMARKDNVKPAATDEYNQAFWALMRGEGHLMEVRNALSVGKDDEGGYPIINSLSKSPPVERMSAMPSSAHWRRSMRTASGRRMMCPRRVHAIPSRPAVLTMRWPASRMCLFSTAHPRRAVRIL